MIITLAVLALVAFLGCEKRSPYYVSTLLPILTVSDIDLAITLDNQDDDSKEKVKEVSVKVKIKDEKKDVIWRVKKIELLDPSTTVSTKITLKATTANPRTKVFDTIEAADFGATGAIFASRWDLADESKWTYVTQEELNAQGALEKEFTGPTFYTKGAGGTDNINAYIGTVSGYDATVNTNGCITKDGKLEAYTYATVTVETQSGETRDYTVKVNWIITGSSNRWKAPVAD